MPQEAERGAGEPSGRRHHVARHTHLAVARRRQKVGLAALLTDDDFGPDEIRATGEVETDHRNARRVRRDVALGLVEQRLNVSRQGRIRLVGLQRRGQPGRPDDQAREPVRNPAPSSSRRVTGTLWSGYNSGSLGP